MRYWLGRSPGKVRIWLESERATVRLYPVRYLTDHEGYGRAMVSLAPRSLLAPETEYSLMVDVPSEDWSGELATFETTGEVDGVAPRWRSRPRYEDEEHTFHGRLTEYDGLLEVGITAWPHGGGKARRTFILFDLDQRCIPGPTADYNVAIYNAQCIDAEERELKNAICDTLYYFPDWRPEGTSYDITIDLRDIAGNLRRIRAPSGRVGLDEPIGLCLAL
jgi:hypothetical protein